MDWVVVAGARPQFVKAAALLPALAKVGSVSLVHTGQHADPRMVEALLPDLGLPEPALRLAPPGEDRALRLAAMVEGLARHFESGKPRAVLSLGDTDTALATALAASCSGTRLAHVEAGARSGDWSMPEEKNRVCVDALSDVLFCSTRRCAENLSGRTGIYVVGDVMADLLLSREEEIRARGPRDRAPRSYGVLTLHRAGTVDDAATLDAILKGVAASKSPVLFPVHPRTAKSLRSLPKGIVRLDPMPYLDFLGLVSGAAFVATDSGGLQKEAYLLGVPCVTCRDGTEWVETVEAGWNVLAGTDREAIAAAVRAPPRGAARPPLYGDGWASGRIARALSDPQAMIACPW